MPHHHDLDKDYQNSFLQEKRDSTLNNLLWSGPQKYFQADSPFRLFGKGKKDYTIESGIVFFILLSTLIGLTSKLLLVSVITPLALMLYSFILINVCQFVEKIGLDEDGEVIGVTFAFYAIIGFFIFFYAPGFEMAFWGKDVPILNKILVSTVMGCIFSLVTFIVAVGVGLTIGFFESSIKKIVNKCHPKE